MIDPFTHTDSRGVGDWTHLTVHWEAEAIVSHTAHVGGNRCTGLLTESDQTSVLFTPRLLMCGCYCVHPNAWYQQIGLYSPVWCPSQAGSSDMSNAHYHREAGSGTIGLSNKNHLTTSQRRSIMVSVLIKAVTRVWLCRTWQPGYDSLARVKVF